MRVLLEERGDLQTVYSGVLTQRSALLTCRDLLIGGRLIFDL